MKRFVPIVLLSLLGFLAQAQDSQLPGDTLMWREDRPLALADFKGPTIESPNMMGEAYCMILTSYGDESESKISVHAIFDRTNSWISNRARREGTLLFQVTFNMFELTARKLRKDAEDLKGYANADELFHDKYISAMSVLTYKCNELKRETRMGADRAKLMEWDEKVKRELKVVKYL